MDLVGAYGSDSEEDVLPESAAPATLIAPAAPAVNSEPAKPKRKAKLPSAASLLNASRDTPTFLKKSAQAENAEPPLEEPAKGSGKRGREDEDDLEGSEGAGAGGSGSAGRPIVFGLQASTSKFVPGAVGPAGKRAKIGPAGVPVGVGGPEGRKIVKQKESGIKMKERDKRAKGQSSHARWKTEDEMRMRQNFDS